MKRREFIGAAGAGIVATALASPAIAQSAPEIKWRCTSSFPKSLDTIYGASEVFAKAVAEATDNKFQIQVFAAGEIVPGLQAADAVQNGTVEMCHTASYYYFGKDPTFALPTAAPFGLNSRMQSAWWRFGGGEALVNDFYKKFNFVALPAGNTGCQMGGWFRKEIKSVDDLKGVKMRVGGFAGQVLAKLGVVPQQIGSGDIYPALEKGTIDAAEWVGPYDDEKLGFNKVAKFYYYPGWWEGGPQLDVLVNLGEWNKLPKEYQNILEAACWEANTWMVAKYDAVNTQAMKRLIGHGAKLHPYPPEVMRAAYLAATAYYEETSRTNPRFKTVYESMRGFRNEVVPWHSLADARFDAFMQATMRAAQKNKK